MRPMFLPCLAKKCAGGVAVFVFFVTFVATMTHSETLMLHLLQAALWQREPDGSRFGSDVDWGEILRVAAKQMVHGLVADAALRTVDEWPESEQMLRRPVCCVCSR